MTSFQRRSMKSNKLDFQKIWIDQCEAAEKIRNEYGLLSALDYLIGEKLFSFVAVAEHRSEFAAELPLFVDEIRRIFTAQQIGCYLDELERSFFEPSEPEEESDLDEAMIPDNPVLGAEEILRFARIREMLQT
jgi:hypothetical protein